ncbi:alpha/beta-hydrolase [Epithele typhae]|uniref:alpha/beta-hydrolase n=1 Tax=Epithele typhae TaxID=378194 RepID=UPI002008B51B|nr:alpha/beta-hydrolase [Epithele typhae]KAH9927439.1 alpha/beta-hydrolase [Epithele typhae]
MEGMDEAEEIQREQLERLRDFLGPQVEATGAAMAKRDSPITFANPKAAEFFVDGTKIPDVNFDAGPSWSGLMPISGAANETRKLFFWFWPTNNASNANDLLFWTNGGPGCSSLEGFLQENGPISWSWGQAEPTPNPFSWTNLANVLWVEQPVGTGFSQGRPDISNDDELAAEVAGFMEQFLEVFSELKGSNFWVSGESYAGFYVPYIANFLYENPNPDLNLKGIWIADPSLTWGLVQQEIPALRFAQANKNVFPFNSTFWAQLQNISDTCGYTDYLDQVTYPPTGLLPLPAGATFNNVTRAVGVRSDCRMHSPIQRLLDINPVFDVYRVTDTFPNLWSVLGFPRSTQEFVYFNRTDVQDAIHAPHISWETCGGPVYINPATGGSGNDQSVASTLSVLPNVIEKSERVAIVHGLADFILVAEGTRIAIQNMTWNGLQGFQTPIEDENFLVDNMGIFGNMHQERGLTYVEFFYSGHMTPQFVPWAAYQTIAYVLGKRDSPSA